MKTKTYSIFGAGAAGLYTAWRLLNGEANNDKDNSKMLAEGDILELYDWGKYDFSKKHSGSREPGARVCTWHYKEDKTKSYLELGGMRYADWNNDVKSGHLLVSTVIKELGLDSESVNFNESSNQLLFLRNRNMYLNDIGAGAPAPYNLPAEGATQSPYNGFAAVQNLVNSPTTRLGWCEFYRNGTLSKETGAQSVFENGDFAKDIGYWNLMYDQLGPEGFAYTADANGYTSNVINWNSADAFNANNEFAPGNQYKTLTQGYSSMFTALFDEIEKLVKKSGVVFKYYPDTRLHSIYEKNNVIHFGIATRRDPWQKTESKTADAAWLAMPRNSIDLVAQATRYASIDGFDVLNEREVQLYLEAAVMQPSYKIGLFFDSEWWLNSAAYPPKLTCYTITGDTLKQLENLNWAKNDLREMEYGNPAVFNIAYDSVEAITLAVSNCIGETLDLEQQTQLLGASRQRNTIGPAFTDSPVRMAVYFGNNALSQSGEKVYGMLASYDDEQFTTFWKELEEGPDKPVDIPTCEDVQPLAGPRDCPPIMIKMLRKQLAEMHFGPGSDFNLVPVPLEARYMDWSLPPFNAGYHAWAAHYDIGDVQRKIRKPSQLIEGKDANIFIVGETYSNDQAWVEGAYCTAESVLNDFFDMKPIVDEDSYPFICPE
ncbi:MAG TPA: hypothetical protein VF721_12775 [Pyrinomonadaceae bacterium]|jgi:hypothetical protein